MSDTEPVHRCGRALSRPAKRLAIAGGLMLASWALGAVLSTTMASADELPSSDTSTVAEANTTSETKSTKSSTSEERTAETSATTEDSTKQEPAERRKKQSSTSGGGLLGGLLGTVVNTLTSTVNAVTSTVTGLVSAVSENVLAPITGGGGSNDGKPPAKLPIIGDLLPSPGDWSEGGQWKSGGSVTITAPAKQVEAAPAAPQPEAPQPAAPVTDTPAVVSHSAPSTHVSAQVVQQQTAVDEPTKSDKRFSAPSGGGSGGRGDLPPAPSAPAAPTTVSVGHDNAGGARQQSAIMASSANTTQLRLIGTSLDHEVDGAGREAALPTTSPD
ncbi:hypothetical protein [Amycolatopsis sp.]|uniref:hypothetical protein n=1 Tax=Amycolatopsis sp. TaxID=37632 RepID=UPI002E09225D|nr:hypothetical protein [Amycolatopsis sp.]